MSLWRPLLLVWLVVGMVLAVTPSHAQDAPPDDPDDVRGKLFLRETDDFRFSGGKHFTTYAPSENNTTQEVELLQRGVTTATASWTQREPPANWTLEPGTEVEARFWLRGLRDMIPTYEPQEYDAPGEAMVKVHLYNGQDTQDSELPLTARSEEPLGSASVSWPYTEVPEGDVEIVLTIAVERGFTFAEGVEGRMFEFRVDVHGGRGVQGSPVRVLVQSAEHPSHIQVPGFPWDAMRMQQDISREAALCREAALRGESCPPSTGEEGIGENAPESGSLFGLPALAVLAALAGITWSIRRHS